MDRIASAAGARVVIHESHFNPLPDEEGFSVAAGYTTAISLKKVYMFQKNTQYIIKSNPFSTLVSIKTQLSNL